MSTAAVILAAGKGTRMKSKIPKVLHKAAGKPLVWHVINSAHRAGIESQIVVVGHGADMVKEEIDYAVDYVVQEEQLGTGHAVMVTEKALPVSVENVLILCGDTPLLRAKTLRKLVDTHLDSGAACTVLSSFFDDPSGYGRIIRDASGRIMKIVEEKDAGAEEKKINEINSGTYCFKKEELFLALKEISSDNAQGEYYLTDVIAIFNRRNLPVVSYSISDTLEILGVNNRVQLAECEKELRRRKNIELMKKGVTIIDPASTYIDIHAEIEGDTTIYPFSFLEGRIQVGEDCQIGPGAQLTNCIVGSGTSIIRSVAVECKIGSDCKIGPFAYLRPGTVLEKGVKIGDFVEIKNSTVQKGSKIPHLSYIGDSQIGQNVNIGAGTITCNFDGIKKWETLIEDGAFIGSNTNLVAPVKVGENSVIGAGSTITKDVPANSLAIAREKQKNIEGWAKKNRKT